MGNSFREQLLKLGLVEKKQVDQVKKKQYLTKKQQQRSRAQEIVDENKALALQAQAEKKERERLRNQQREEELRRKQEAEQVRQLIASHCLAQDRQGTAFRFADGGKVQRIFVAAAMVDGLSRGLLAISRSGPAYEVIPAGIAEKIIRLDPAVIVLWNRDPKNAAATADDAYAGYEIPDDLVW
ncbi:DUF2058 domain-containing protein [Desulfoprunum benzoelyticum]|uniref:Nucleoprotein/polynucleotide-associated enzyme n=1 Tax=Desulfoprunum benzoelyticum TaxID=1506996 RepID=A0A840UR30_9BACT|nr:DUF2058 family protein [Desulfoprunum benzoelyticum]MBB5347103.1 hypothetical protein [Desulfoprunum benzoelyticum]MBM9529797.1 DUF2058 domain-containing protein [Desulfoprunum benzoelyticum]